MNFNYVILEKAGKRFLVWDIGVASDHARRLAKDGNKVRYFTEWIHDATPHFEDYAYGLGFEGITKEMYFFQEIDNVDCICFFYIGKGDMADWLRKKGYTVFGAGLGEQLELDRLWAIKLQEKIGKPIIYKSIRGVDNVLDYIKKHPQVYVKINIFRGDMNTFYGEDYESAKVVLNNLRAKQGPFEDSYEFIVEDKIDDVVVETGWDLFFNGTDFVKPYLWGYLVKDSYIGKYTDTLPPILEKVADAFRPVLKELNYRGAISTEVMVTKDRDPYLLDITARMPYEMGILYTYAIINYFELILKIARGEDSVLKPRGKFVGSTDANTLYAIQNWAKVSYPKKFSDQIRVQGSKHNGSEYSAPNEFGDIASVITAKDSVSDVLKDLNMLSEQLSAFEYESKGVDEDEVKEVIAKGKSVGLDF